MKLPLQCITKESFAPFGRILEFPSECQEPFHIVVTEEASPWRLAVFRVKDREISTMEAHPTTMESFEPLKGMGVLLLARPDSPGDPAAFLLDRPVCLYKSVWHQLLSLTEEVQVKITENLDVPGTQFYQFPKPVGVYVL